MAQLSTPISCLLEVVSTHPAYVPELGTRVHRDSRHKYITPLQHSQHDRVDSPHPRRISVVDGVGLLKLV